MNLICLPALTDNYIWLLYDDYGRCQVVDPGEAAPVLQVFDERHFNPSSSRPRERLKRTATALSSAGGPEETVTQGATHIVHEGDSLTLLDHPFSIMALPGHTLGHIGFYSAPWLFLWRYDFFCRLWSTM